MAYIVYGEHVIIRNDMSIEITDTWLNNFKSIQLNENLHMSYHISLNIILKSLIDNISELFEIMAWCRICDQPQPRSLSQYGVT